MPPRTAVELALGHLTQKIQARVLLAHGDAVRALGRQRVEYVDDADDLREQRHLVSAQPVRISAAVEALVMAAHDRPHAPQRLQRRTQRVADLRMPPHHLEFSAVSGPGLSSTESGTPTLPTSCR